MSEAAAFRRQLRKLDLGRADVVVVLSPHGRETGVYRNVAGTLDRFGVTGFELRRTTDAALVDALADAWSAPVIDDAVDHGVLVPLLLASLPDVPVVAACLADWTEEHRSLRDVVSRAKDFAACLTRVTADRAATFVASGHTAAALSPTAPLTERAQGQEAHIAVTEAFRFGWGLDDVDLDLWRAAGTCGAGPFIALARLFRGSEARLVGFAQPFGVGYQIATVT